MGVPTHLSIVPANLGYTTHMSASSSGSPLPGLGAIETWTNSAHSEGGSSFGLRTLLIVFAIEIVLFFMVTPGQTMTNFQFLLFISPLWIPALLYRFGMERYIDANKVVSRGAVDHILLEIKLPRDTRRGPLAMETVFSSMHIAGGDSTWYKRIVQGRTRPSYSYEIVSLGGRVHYFVRMREQFRRPFESYIYAQYPGVEVIEAMDYSRLINPAEAPYKMTAFEFKKTDVDPLPIKTYIEYGLDKVQKPEEQVDPLAQLLEVMGSLGPKEQLWLQFVVRVHKKDGKYGPGKSWKDIAKEEIQKIRDAAVTEIEMIDMTGAAKKIKGGINPTEGQRERAKAIEHNIGKQPYDIGIRGIYCAPVDAAHRAMGGILANIFKPFNSEQYNSLMPNGRWSDHFNEYPWEDRHGHHYAQAMRDALHCYRSRSFFHPFYIGPYSVMSTEELATIYHIPSGSVTTPNLPRIQSTTSEAPPNLPT